MPQFDVYPDPNPGSRHSVPFVVDVQSGLIDALPTRLVMRLSRWAQARLACGKPLSDVEVAGERSTPMPHLAAAIDRRLLRKPVLSVSHRANDIGAARGAVFPAFDACQATSGTDLRIELPELLPDDPPWRSYLFRGEVATRGA